MRTNIVGLKEFRNNVDSYTRAVKKGQFFIVVKRSKPIFTIGPVEEVDERKDEKGWKTIIDFTKIRKGGVDAREVLNALTKIRSGQNRKISKKTAKKRSNSR